ncbi:MAG: hypothetical protein M3373_01095 [Gemmatimonadota bacterium]|nr:hypothetical protein [Gemmatimonadota bacterium]
MSLLLLVLLSTVGCYIYTPLQSAPPLGTRVALDLNDGGRAVMGDTIGPEVSRVEGDLLRNSDSLYVLEMRAVEGFRGNRVKWSGEPVGFRPDHVRFMSERKLSKGRTALAVGAAAATVVAFVFSRDIFGIGADDPGRLPPPNGNGEVFRGRP